MTNHLKPCANYENGQDYEEWASSLPQFTQITPERIQHNPNQGEDDNPTLEFHPKDNACNYRQYDYDSKQVICEASLDSGFYVVKDNSKPYQPGKPVFRLENNQQKDEMKKSRKNLLRSTQAELKLTIE